jgi:hypothetical protein
MIQWDFNRCKVWELEAKIREDYKASFLLISTIEQH